MQTILITGATDGIGLALARLYAERGARLVLVGRRALGDVPDEAFFSEVSYCQADLSRPDHHTLITNHLQKHQITHLDLLIHNAGVGYVGDLTQQSWDNISQLVQVNLQAPIDLSYVLFPYLERADKGKVVFVSSVASVMPTPEYAVYTATKAALDGLARSLRVEWQGRVAVQTIWPGATRTGMHEKAGADREQMDWTKFRSAGSVAGEMVRVMEGNRPGVTIGLSNKMLRLVGRTFPNLIEKLTINNQRKTENGKRPTLHTPHSTPHIIITGSADGIGFALAKRFVQAGYRVTGVDRDAVRAGQVAAELGERMGFVIADLAVEEDLKRVVAEIDPAGVVIHNAGINATGKFEQLPLAQQKAVVDINLIAPLKLTQALLTKGHRPHTWVFISSLSHFVGYPGAVTYSATKDGLASFARSLPAQTLTVFPGPTRTAHAREHSPDNSREDRRMPPDQLAEMIFKAVQRRHKRLVPGRANRLFAILGRLFPRLMGQAMRRTIYEKLP